MVGSTASSDGDVKNKLNNATRDLWMIRLNNEGDIVWETSLGGNNTE